MKSENLVFDNVLIGDLYHWRRDYHGKISIKENVSKVGT